MTDRWSTDDVIEEEPINKRSIRKGSSSELTSSGIGTLHDGDVLYNETERCPTTVYHANNTTRSQTKFSNIKTLLNADSDIVQNTGTTAIGYKEFSILKTTTGFSGNKLYFVANLFANIAGTTTMDVVVVGSPTLNQDVITTSTDSTNLEEFQIDISELTNGKYTIELYIKHSTSTGVVTLEDVEVWGV